jgi:hypothetical protein
MMPQAEMVFLSLSAASWWSTSDALSVQIANRKLLTQAADLSLFDGQMPRDGVFVRFLA